MSLLQVGNELLREVANELRWWQKIEAGKGKVGRKSSSSSSGSSSSSKSSSSNYFFFVLKNIHNIKNHNKWR